MGWAVMLLKQLGFFVTTVCIVDVTAPQEFVIVTLTEYVPASVN
jgi:hypothetical protein